jgi:hypothetical protein
LDKLGAADMGSGFRSSHRKAQKFDVWMDRKLLPKESQKVMSLCLHSFVEIQRDLDCGFHPMNFITLLLTSFVQLIKKYICMFIVVVACGGSGKLDHVVLITPYIAKWISAIFCDIESLAKFFEKFSKIIQICNF